MSPEARPERTELVGTRTVCREVWPKEARTMMSGPRSPAWADDYPTPGTTSVIRRFLALVEEGDWVPGFGMYTLQPRDGLVCGLAFYGTPDRDGRVEVGYGLAPSGRGGRGLMTDALQAAVAWAFDIGGVLTVWAGVDEDNLPSIATLERWGFTRHDDNRHGRVYERKTVMSGAGGAGHCNWIGNALPLLDD